MIKLIIIISFFITTHLWAFTLNPNTGRGFESNKINIHIANSSCSGAGFDTAVLKNMVGEAIDHYWNQVPTSALFLKSAGINCSIDINGDDFDAALLKVPNNSIVAGCNNDVPDFSNAGILGATVMDCNGDTCKAILILNANNSALKTMNKNERIAVIAHEIGHAFGLGHSEYTQNLMYYSASGKDQKWLGEDDIDGVSYLYPHDPELAGLIGSCGSIKNIKEKDHSFWLQFLLSFFMMILLGNRHFLNKFSKSDRQKTTYI